MKKRFLYLSILLELIFLQITAVAQNKDGDCRKVPVDGFITSCIYLQPAPDSRVDNPDGTTSITFLLTYNCSDLPSVRLVEFTTVGPIVNANSSYSFYTDPLLQFPGSSNPNTWNFASGQISSLVYDFREGSFLNNEARFNYTLNTADFDNQVSLNVRVLTGGFSASEPVQEYRFSYSRNDLLNCGITNPIQLPIELMSFKGFSTKNGVRLEWSTAMEKDNEYFTLEQSPNAHVFTEVARVKGAGNSTRKLNYSYVHKNVKPGVTYYRLKQTDFDGTVSYSKTIAVNELTQKTVVSAYPNPSSGRFSLTGLSTVVEGSIMDVTGRPVKKLTNLAPDYSVDLSDQKPGIYFLHLHTGNEIKTVRLIKK